MCTAVAAAFWMDGLFCARRPATPCSALLFDSVPIRSGGRSVVSWEGVEVFEGSGDETCCMWDMGGVRSVADVADVYQTWPTRRRCNGGIGKSECEPLDTTQAVERNTVAPVATPTHPHDHHHGRTCLPCYTSLLLRRHPHLPLPTPRPLVVTPRAGLDCNYCRSELP